MSVAETLKEQVMDACKSEDTDKEKETKTVLVGGPVMAEPKNVAMEKSFQESIGIVSQRLVSASIS